MKYIIFILFSFCSLSAGDGEPLIGQTIQSPTNSYTLLRELGKGSFGKVFEASSASGKKFALKWYLSTEFPGWFGDHLADHQREFMLGQILDHPHIIKSVESFADKDKYTVLEFVPGQTLDSCRKGSLELLDAILAIKQFISGVRHAFSQEFLHLDLHGNNVMINQDKEVKIIDLSSFFSFQEIRDHASESATSTSYEKIKQFAARHPLCMGYSSKSKTLISHYVVSNFDDVTDLCIRILLRGKLTRDERMNVRADLKKIAWNCEADLEAGILIDFESYLDSLESLIESYQLP